ncbi:MAG TPA: hypothetical protein QF353_00895 [Gammaproteobacteria bacterium]|nr:hypothetical protein [Gammaproteobacteria bacterium]
MRTLIFLCALPLCLAANSDSIKVYSNPSTQSKITGHINPQENYSIKNDWVHISHQKTHGWVRLHDLQKAQHGSWNYQQTFSSSSNLSKKARKDFDKSMRHAEELMSSMFNSRPFFSPFDRPIIIINQKDSSHQPHQKD